MCILQCLASFRKQQWTGAWNWMFRMHQAQFFRLHVVIFFPRSHYWAFRFTTGRWTTRTRRKRWRSCFCPRRVCGWKTWPATRTTWSNCLRLMRQETVLSVSPGGGALFNQVRLCPTSLQFTLLYCLFPALLTISHSLNGKNHNTSYVQCVCFISPE